MTVNQPIRVGIAGLGRSGWNIHARLLAPFTEQHRLQFIDLALQLFGDAEPTQVYPHLDRTLTLGDADDHVKLVFKGEGTPTVDMKMSASVA